MCVEINLRKVSTIDSNSRHIFLKLQNIIIFKKCKKLCGESYKGSKSRLHRVFTFSKEYFPEISNYVSSENPQKLLKAEL